MNPRALPLVLALLAGCPPAVEPPPPDPCVDEPTTAIQLLDLVTSKKVYPGEIASFGYRIDTRDAEGVLGSAEAEITVEGTGEFVGAVPGSVAWRVGMAHGTFDVRVQRKGCPADFIIDKLVVAGPALEAVRSEPPGSLGGSGVAWSPDSRYFAIASQGLLRVYDTDGDYVRGVRTGFAQVHQHVAWSPDGAWIAVAGDDGLDRGPLLLKADRLTPWTRFPRDRGYGVAFDPESSSLFALDVVYVPNQGILAAELQRLDLASGLGMRLAGDGGHGEPPYDVSFDAHAIYTGALAQKRDNHVALRKYGCDDDRVARTVASHPASGLVYARTDRYLCAVNPATGDASPVRYAPMFQASSIALDPLGEGVVMVGRACSPQASECTTASAAVFRGDLSAPESLALATRRIGGESFGVAWSPDGAYVVVSVPGGKGFELVPRAELWTYWGVP